MEGKEMKELKNWLLEEESGQGLVEYALIVGLIALVCVLAITSTGGAISSIWDKIHTQADAADTAVTP
jgi:pilus assembly protein Flp/PilA